MTHWDGLLTDAASAGGSHSQAHVVVLGATNRPHDLDQAILRRLPRSFEIGLPSERGRASIVALLLGGEALEGSCDVASVAQLVAKRTEGYSGSDLKEVRGACAWRRKKRKELPFL
jgi:SpoVK/Ycf46/Vps4 family AAA+-type ATPase